MNGRATGLEADATQQAEHQGGDDAGPAPAPDTEARAGAAQAGGKGLMVITEIHCPNCGWSTDDYTLKHFGIAVPRPWVFSAEEVREIAEHCMCEACWSRGQLIATEPVR